MNIVKILSTEFGNFSRRVVKSLRHGLDENVTAIEAAPYGTDANPIAGMAAIYSETGIKGKQVIVGYLNVNQLAGVGEHRLYSTDSDGKLKTFIWLHNDGTIDLGGTSDNSVRYAALNQALQSFKDAINVELTKAQAGIIAAGGTYARLPLTIDLTAAKINEIKTS